jgi:hypothetical protein
MLVIPTNLTPMIKPVKLRTFRDAPGSYIDILCFMPTLGILRRHRRPRSG